MTRIARRTRTAAAAVALALTAAAGAVAVTAGPAQAALPYVWNDIRGEVLMYYAPSETHSNVKAYVPNGTSFDMDCWLDNAGFRWFAGTEHHTGKWGYIRANWVYNQETVGSC